MTTKLKIENYSSAKEYYFWLDEDAPGKLIVIHSFKIYYPLNDENLENISRLLIEKLDGYNHNLEKLKLIIRDPNSGSKVDRYKGIWKRDYIRKQFENNSKYEYEYKIDENLYNIGVADLPINQLSNGLSCLIRFPRWSFILIDIKENIRSDLGNDFLPPSIISSDDHSRGYNYLFNEFVTKGCSLISYGDGGEDWVFSMAYP